MHKYAIVGLGPAGIFALASLPIEELEHTIVFEPALMGGDLAAHYGAVVANIPKADMITAFRMIPRWAAVEFPLLAATPDDACPLLADVAKQLRALVREDLARVDVRTLKVTAFQQTADQAWLLQAGGRVFDAQNLILTPGAPPKTLDLPLPSIPLPIALHKERLALHVNPTERILVIGTSHSGTLILKNLKDLGCTHVTAFYRGEKPFSFARDGDPEGIKQESATIADEILSKAWGPKTPTLLRTDDLTTQFRVLQRAQYVIYAMGFGAPALFFLDPYGHLQRFSDVFEPSTSTFTGAQRAWGFGIGFPRLYTAPNGKQTPDVAFKPFLEAIQAAMPRILAPTPSP